MFSYHFDMLILKITFKNKKKYYFNIFLDKKYFKKQPHFQLHFNQIFSLWQEKHKNYLNTEWSKMLSFLPFLFLFLIKKMIKFKSCYTPISLRTLGRTCYSNSDYDTENH
jgi:hypothetical protein